MLRVLLAIFGYFFIPGNSYAFTMEFYAYKNFVPMDAAFTKLVLILSDPQFEALMGVMILGSVAFSEITVIKQALETGSFNPLKPLGKIAVGYMIYLGIVIPTGTIVLTDPVLQRSKAIDGIPEALVLFIGATNLLERTFVDIIDTTVIEPAFKYQNAHGGIGFSLLKNISSLKPEFSQGSGVYQESLKEYIKQCLYFELVRPGTTIKIDDIKNNDDWLPILGAASNPNISTVAYTAAIPTGTPMSCAEAWSGAGDLNNFFSSDIPFQGLQKVVCKKAGFNVTVPTELIACTDIIESHVKLSTGTAMPSSHYIRQMHVGKTLNNLIINDPAAAGMAMANQKIMTQAKSTWMVADEYMPIIRGVMFSISIMIIPIIILLLPTPVYGKATHTFLGFWSFLIMWGIMDCLYHALAVEVAMQYFMEAQAHGTGFTAMILTPDATGKALGVFGITRMITVSLAAYFCQIMGLSGGSVMAGFISQAMSTVRAGAAAGEQAATIQGQGQMLGSLQSGAANVSQANNVSYQNMVAAESAHKQERSASGGQKVEDMEAIRGAAIVNEQVKQAVHHEKMSRAEANGDSLATQETNMAMRNVDDTLGRNKAEDDTWSQINVNSDQQRAEMQAGKAISQEIADKNGGLIAGMQIDKLQQGENGHAMAKVSGILTTDKQVQEHRDLMKKNDEDITDSQLEKIHKGSVYNATLNTQTGEGDFTYSSGVKGHDTTAFSSTNTDRSIYDTSKSLKAGTSMDGNTAEALAQRDELASHLYDKEGNYSQSQARIQAEALAAKLSQSTTAQNTTSLSAQATLGLAGGGSSVSASTSASYQETLNGNMKRIQAIQDDAKEQAMMGDTMNQASHDSYYNTEMAKLFPDADQKLRDGGFETDPKKSAYKGSPGAFSSVIKD